MLVLLVASTVRADPELGTSTRGVTRWSSSGLEVTPVFAQWRGRGRVFVYQWDATLDGVDVDHARFYELVGRPDLARRITYRRLAGALTIAAGLATMGLGVDLLAHGHPGWAAPAWLGGGVIGFAGAYVEIEADPTSASEAQELAAEHGHFMLGYGGKF